MARKKSEQGDAPPRVRRARVPVAERLARITRLIEAAEQRVSVLKEKHAAIVRDIRAAAESMLREVDGA